MKLSQAQIEVFDREGWLFLPELFSPEETTFLAREAEAIYAARAMRSIEPGISRFRVRVFDAPRTDGLVIDRIVPT